MHIKNADCPNCTRVFVVDGGLFDIGHVPLRCPFCHYQFVPRDSPGTRTVRDVTNASVEIRIWEPEDSR